jgi:hypothetical protein
MAGTSGGVRRRAADQDDHLLGVRPPFQLVHGGLETLQHGLFPVAAALRDDARQKALDLLPAEREVGPAHQEVLALLGRGRHVVVAAVPKGDRADACRGDEPLHGADQRAEPLLQLVDHVLHAAGGVDHQCHVEAHPAQLGDVLAKGAAERDAETATTAAEAQAARPGPGRREAPGKIGPGALRAHRALEVDDRALGDDGAVGARDLDRLTLLRLEQLLELIVVVGTHVLGQILDREDLPGAFLTEPHAAAGAETEAPSDAEAEAAPDARHVEDDRQDEQHVQHCRSAERGRQAARLRPQRRGGWRRRGHAKARLLTGGSSRLSSATSAVAAAARAPARARRRRRRCRARAWRA